MSPHPAGDVMVEAHKGRGFAVSGPCTVRLNHVRGAQGGATRWHGDM